MIVKNMGSAAALLFQDAIDEATADLRRQLAEAKELLEADTENHVCFGTTAAERMAGTINRLVRRHTIDARSEAADAALDWRDPKPSDRPTRADLQAQVERLEKAANAFVEAAEQQRIQLIVEDYVSEKTKKAYSLARENLGVLTGEVERPALAPEPEEKT